MELSQSVRDCYIQSKQIRPQTNKQKKQQSLKNIWEEQIKEHAKLYYGSGERTSFQLFDYI